MPNKFSGQTRALKSNFNMQLYANQDERANKRLQSDLDYLDYIKQRELDTIEKQDRALRKKAQIEQERQYGKLLYDNGLADLISDIYAGVNKEEALEKFHTKSKWRLDKYDEPDENWNIKLYRKNKTFVLTPSMQEAIYKTAIEEEQRKNDQDVKKSKIDKTNKDMERPEKTAEPKVYGGEVFKTFSSMGYSLDDFYNKDNAQRTNVIRDMGVDVLRKANKITDDIERNRFIRGEFKKLAQDAGLSMKETQNEDPFAKYRKNPSK